MIAHDIMIYFIHHYSVWIYHFSRGLRGVFRGFDSLFFLGASPTCRLHHFDLSSLMAHIISYPLLPSHSSSCVTPVGGCVMTLSRCCAYGYDLRSLAPVHIPPTAAREVAVTTLSHLCVARGPHVIGMGTCESTHTRTHSHGARTRT